MFTKGENNKYLKNLTKEHSLTSLQPDFCSEPFLSRCIHQGYFFLLFLVEKATIRPAKSMDSLCSVPVEGELSQPRSELGLATGRRSSPPDLPSGCRHSHALALVPQPP